MFCIKPFKTKNRVTFTEPLDCDYLVIIYFDGEWKTKNFKRSKKGFTCTISLDKNVKSLEFIYVFTVNGAIFYRTEPDTQLVDNPYGTKNSIIYL